MIIGPVIHLKAIRYKPGGRESYVVDEYVCTSDRDFKPEHQAKVKQIDALRRKARNDAPTLTGWTPGIGSSMVFGTLVTYYTLDMGQD
jgi:hypothetical protein